MNTFIEHSNACASCQRDKDAISIKCGHKLGYIEKLKELTRTKSLRPLGLLLFCMCVIQSSGNAAIRPFLVQIFETFRIPMDSDRGAVSNYFFTFLYISTLHTKVLMGFIDIATCLFCVFAIPIAGKRFMMLIGLSGVVVFCFGVATNAFLYLSFDASSFRFERFPESESKDNSYALVLFCCLGVSASISGCVPWIMNGEVYPFRYSFV